jgi:hypothetical protein
MGMCIKCHNDNNYTPTYKRIARSTDALCDTCYDSWSCSKCRWQLYGHLAKGVETEIQAKLVYMWCNNEL